MPRLKLLIVLLFLLSGCQSREVRPKISGSEYFPLKGGHFWIYDVVETHISLLNGQTNSLYELKVELADSVMAGGQVEYILHRYRREDASQAWVALDTWSALSSPFQIVVREGNISFIKFALPLSEGKTWDGNALNTLGGTEKCENGNFTCDNYTASNLQEKYEGTVRYDDTVSIIENNLNDPIVKSDIRKSVYAKSIGLIYREISILEYCTVGNCIGKQVVEDGFILKQTIKEYAGI